MNGCCIAAAFPRGSAITISRRTEGRRHWRRSTVLSGASRDFLAKDLGRSSFAFRYRRVHGSSRCPPPPASHNDAIVSLGIISKPGELVICEERRSECVPVSLTRWQEALDMVASVFDSEHVLQRHALHLLRCRSAAERLSGRLLTRPVPSPCCERSTHSILNPASL